MIVEVIGMIVGTGGITIEMTGEMMDDMMMMTRLMREIEDMTIVTDDEEGVDEMMILSAPAVLNST